MIATNNKKLLTVSLHVLAWISFIILPQLIINKYWGNQNFVAWGFYLNAAAYGAIFYINYILLVPRLYFNGKKLLYFICVIATIGIMYFIFQYFNGVLFRDPERDKMISEAFDKLIKDGIVPKPPVRQLHVYYFILTSIIISALAFGLKVIERHAISEKKQKELEKEKLNSELAFLKNQISPHFFFNTLNNIYALIEVSTKDAQESVLTLSKMMRYLLYESEQGESDLKQEVDFLKHYVDLMRLRVSNKVNFDIQLPHDTFNLKVPPLLFIPFVENAFKHGISYREDSFIRIKMTIEDQTINFNCNNSLFKTNGIKSAEKENHSGIGLENVKKRLQLLFPNHHDLNIDESNGQFNVQLKIDLKA